MYIFVMEFKSSKNEITRITQQTNLHLIGRANKFEHILSKCNDSNKETKKST